MGEIIQQLRPEQNYEVKKWAGKLKDIVCLILGCTREQIEDRVWKETPLGEEWWYWQHKGRGSIYPYLDYKNMDEPYWTLIKTTPRLMLQLLGTEAGRQVIHPNIWVNALMSEYKENPPSKGGELGAYTHPECIDCKKPFNGYKRQFICNSCHDTHDWFPNWLITDTRFPNELGVVKQNGGVTLRIVRDTDDKEATHASETALDNATFDYTISNNGTIEDLTEEVKIFLGKYSKI